MARGFWTGLVHGAVLGAAALAVLSLVTPLSDSRPVADSVPEVPADLAATDQPAPVLAEDAADVAEAEPTPNPAPEPAPLPAVPVNSGPDAASVDLPVGSEFGRGDIAPVLPAPLTVPEGRSVSEAPAVSAPAAEPSPVTATAVDPRPDALIDADGPERVQPAAGDTAPVLDVPQMQSLPQAAALPQMGAAGQADLLPVLPDVADQTDASVETPVAVDYAPRDVPAPDLSLPPSLSDLGTTSRD